MSNTWGVTSELVVFAAAGAALLVLSRRMRRRNSALIARATPLTPRDREVEAANAPVQLPASVRTSRSQLSLAALFVLFGLLFALAPILDTTNKIGVSGALTMAAAGAAFFVGGLNALACRVRSTTDDLRYTSLFRRLTVNRRDIDSVAVVLVPGNGYQPGPLIGVRIAFKDGTRQPLVPNCLRSYDSKRNRRMLQRKASLLRGCALDAAQKNPMPT